jgi:hypothetical protein
VVDHPDLLFRLRAVPAAAFVDLLREAGEPLDVGQMKDRLEALGVDRETVQRVWRRAQPGVKRHGNVVFDPATATYRWSDGAAAAPLSAAQALERIVRGRLAAAARAELADTVRAALRERDELLVRVRGYEARLGSEGAAERSGSAVPQPDGDGAAPAQEVDGSPPSQDTDPATNATARPWWSFGGRTRGLATGMPPGPAVARPAR